MSKFYLTTPIYYVNARPHIGHAYTTIVADVLARRHRLLGDDTFFLTGTDEHGQKIERSAAAAGVPPQEFADQVSAQFEGLWKRMGIVPNDFIRTTDPKHQRGVQKLFSELYEKGFIYLDSYTGQYSVGEEMFVEGPPGTIGPDGKPTETVTEENFFFKLSAFQRPLLDLIESDEIKIENGSRRNEVLSFIRGNLDPVLTHPAVRGATRSGEVLSIDDLFDAAYNAGLLKKTRAGHFYVTGALKDLSVSRSSFTWGIPVPEPAASAAKERHVIYVWLDALANYMTAIGYGSEDPEDQAEFAKYWPADLHLVGKEIIRFHCVYWPAFLLALNPLYHAETEDKGIIDVLNAAEGPLHIHKSKTDPRNLTAEQHSAWAEKFLPKKITAHGWLLFDNSKMSKSKGNIVRTETILDGFGDHVYGKQFPDSTKAERDLFASDVLRYFLLREIPFGQDGSFSFDALITRYNADLANGYGNLVSRTLSMIQKYFDSVIPGLASNGSDYATNAGENQGSIYTKVVVPNAADAYGNTDFGSAMRIIYSHIGVVDGYVTSKAPWKMMAEEPPNITGVAVALYTAAESIRIITALLYPILPNATAKVWQQLGLGDIELAARNGELNNLQWGGLKPGTKLGPLAPIFPRADKGLVQIMTDMENPEAGSSKPEAENATTRPVTSLNAGETSTFAKVVPTRTFDPAAPPRTSAIEEPAAGSHVGGSSAITTERPTAPSHTEATPSGMFASVASQVPVSASDTAAAQLAPQITIDDFAKIELRVAEIKVAERIPKADKLLRLEVDLGYEKRQILSGIAEWYTPEELIGRRIVVITNLAPRKMRGLESHGMLLAASHGEGGKPVLATFGEEIALGSRLK